MRDIVIDVTRLADRLRQGRLPTGVDRVSLDYVRHFFCRSLAMVRYGGRWLEIDEAGSERLFSELLEPGEDVGRSIVRSVAAAYLRPTRPRRQRPSFLFNTGHSGLDLPDFGRRVRRAGLRPVFFVHDLIPIRYPEYCRQGEKERHQRRMDTVLAVGEGLVVNSRTTLVDLEAYAEGCGRPVPPAVVAWLPPPRLPEPLATPPLAKPYFVVLGTIEPRKNHWMLLQVWRRLVETMGDAAPRLAVIGQRGWECENVVDLLERCETLRGFVVERPGCSDAELATWLNHAQALLFPSFAEGYGLPLVEALSTGVPAIVSDLPAFRELAGDVPEYLDPVDGLGWLAKVREYAADGRARREQMARMAKFAVPDRAAHFALVEDLLDRLRRRGR